MCEGILLNDTEFNSLAPTPLTDVYDVTIPLKSAQGCFGCLTLTMHEQQLIIVATCRYCWNNQM